MQRREYDAAQKRAGKIFHVLSIQSLPPRVLRASIGLYQALMIEEGELPRWVRELLAVVVRAGQVGMQRLAALFSIG